MSEINLTFTQTVKSNLIVTTDVTGQLIFTLNGDEIGRFSKNDAKVLVRTLAEWYGLVPRSVDE
jgi:hypothetical protein